MAFLGYVWYHGLFVSCLGWCRTFFLLLLVMSICTELLCFGRGIGINWLNNCFWNILAALKRAWQVKDPPPDWMATEETAAVETVL